MRTRKRPRRTHVGKVSKQERHRFKRKGKATHTARMAYWERRKSLARLRAEAKDPDKRALALLEMERDKAVAKAGKPWPRRNRGYR